MIILFCLLFCSIAVDAKLLVVDQIEKVVCGPMSSEPITYTDVNWKRSLSGDRIPEERQIQMKIVKQQLEEEKIPVDDSVALKYLDSIKANNNMSQEQLIDLFSEVGLLYDEGAQQLIDQYAYDMFLHHKFRSQVLVTDDQVVSYHKKNPEFESAWFEIKIGTVSYDADTKDSVERKVDELVAGESSGLFVDWSEPMKVEDQYLSEDKFFIKELKEGEMYAVDNGVEFDIYHLVRKKAARKKDLNERRADITENLSRRQFEDLLEEYNTKIEDKIRIIDL